jgi:hypothetical protein
MAKANHITAKQSSSDQSLDRAIAAALQNPQVLAGLSQLLTTQAVKPAAKSEPAKAAVADLKIDMVEGRYGPAIRFHFQGRSWGRR